MFDAQPVNLDAFCEPDPALGLIASGSPHDPPPSLRVSSGVVVELDGKERSGFDLIDEFIAAHGLDLDVAQEAMSIPSIDVATMLVDPRVERGAISGLVSGMTPAKLAEVVALLSPVELQVAVAKMHVRATPSIQAHVTNQLDDPILLAADAASAVAFGFRELETTVPVLADASANAVALMIGSQVPGPGALCQCSVEEAVELDLGLRGLTTYAETVSLYGTVEVFIDGDDTPWSKAFLGAAYASRGIKMRVTSGAGSEVLMGATQGCSMLYLESRCVSLARAMGSQGVQNGGIDGASIAASVPGGMRELLAENLMVMMRDLESCSGNDTLISESDIRRASHSLPLVLAGSDFTFSGYGSITRYDNTFATSNFNAEDLDDYLVIQRDWGIDGGLRPITRSVYDRVRRRAANACRDVFAELGLAEFEDEHVQAAVDALDSRALPKTDPLLVLHAAQRIDRDRIGVLEVVAALDRRGYTDIAQNLLMTAEVLRAGDHLQVAAILTERLDVLSKINDPNRYAGPGTGYQMSAARRREIDGIRQARSRDALVLDQQLHRHTVLFQDGESAQAGNDPAEVCIGLSPALGVDVWVSLSDMAISDVVEEIERGIAEEGCLPRLIRIHRSVDLGRIGLTAAELSGSGIAVGLQGKGTALIHRRGLAPLANLELFSEAPRLTWQHYRQLGRNAARYALGHAPAPILLGGTEHSMTARYHARAIALTSMERARCTRKSPTQVSLRRLETTDV
jgi:propanediol dehydratase large subunit